MVPWYLVKSKIDRSIYGREKIKTPEKSAKPDETLLFIIEMLSNYLIGF